MPSNTLRNPQSPKQKPLANSGIGKGSGKVINPSKGTGSGSAVNPTMPKKKC